MRPFRSLWLTVLAAVLSAEAHVIHVPEDAPTIQAALNQLTDADTVLVALGVYAEALTAPPLHFTLKGEPTCAKTR